MSRDNIKQETCNGYSGENMLLIFREDRKREICFENSRAIGCRKHAVDILE
jgi:hypothetical protein